jgi:H+/Cl- antiporter ClcA
VATAGYTQGVLFWNIFPTLGRVPDCMAILARILAGFGHFFAGRFHVPVTAVMRVAGA